MLPNLETSTGMNLKMALWTATNRGGRALGSTIPGAFPRPIFCHFTTQGAKHVDEENRDDEASDRKRESGGSGVREMAGFVAEKAKKGTRKAAEMVFETGESMAEGKKESWGYWKETAQKTKEDLLGDKHDKSHRRVND